MRTRTVVKGSVAVVFAIGVAACVGASYEAVEREHDVRRFPQVGRTIETGDLRINLHCSGTGVPIVILESGSGVPAIGWSQVQLEVSKFSRVCSYDRAGYGWSAPGAKPRTGQRIATELKAVLTAAGERGPYVLVGHSFGGFCVRIFTGVFPSDVVGLVLVDAASEDEAERMTELLPPSLIQRETSGGGWSERLAEWTAPLRVRLGIDRMRLEVGQDVPGAPLSVPKPMRRQLWYLRDQRKQFEAEEAEGEAELETIGEVRNAGTLGDRPLVVLTAGEAYDHDIALSPAEKAAEIKVWNILQAEQARLSSRGRQVVAPGSGHMIPYERPDAVVNAIREVRAAVESNAGKR